MYGCLPIRLNSRLTKYNVTSFRDFIPENLSRFYCVTMAPKKASS